MTLRGRIADEVHVGPPTDGDDAMLVAFVIVPARPLCLQRSGAGPDIENITRVQIAGDLGSRRAPEQVGHDVVARGVLFEPETGYHYTPVLIHITDSVLSRPRPR